MLEGDGETVGGRAGQAGGADELRECGRTGLEGAEHRGRLVENADSTRVVHDLILPSQALRRQFIAPSLGTGWT